MTYLEALETVRRHFESLFPKNCSTCGRRFASLREYILSTRRVGRAISYDAELGDWQTQQPIGSLAFANCPCGSTLVLSTEGMPLPQRQALLAWVRDETEKQHVTPSELLERIRNDLRKEVLEG
jgi:hypothetical protein